MPGKPASTVFMVAAFMVAALIGCVQGNRFDPALVNQLKPGISTMQDATRMLGKPSSVGIIDAQGDRILQWYFAYGTATVGAGGAAHAAIIFGPDERMIRVSQFSEE